MCKYCLIFSSRSPNDHHLPTLPGQPGMFRRRRLHVIVRTTAHTAAHTAANTPTASSFGQHKTALAQRKLITFHFSFFQFRLQHRHHPQGTRFHRSSHHVFRRTPCPPRGTHCFGRDGQLLVGGRALFTQVMQMHQGQHFVHRILG